MEHHPIPQQISSYEFRLVGSMTLKQFIKLAGGLILAFVVYHSQLIFFIKWPLIIGLSSLGAALAFMPINEQPLEKWIIAFFQSVYSPTIYIWQKQAPALDFEERGFQQPDADEEPEPVDSKEKEPKLEEFLATIEEDKEFQPKADPPLAEKVKSEKEKIKEPTTEDKKPEPKEEKDKPEYILDFPDRKAPETTAEAEFGEIPRPEPPNTPNKVVGMVFNQEGKMIENAIIEIQDQNGNPVRALRTNKIGQFETATPLSNGEYIISVEKDGYQFDILKIEAKGEVLSPLIIKAKQNQES